MKKRVFGKIIALMLSALMLLSVAVSAVCAAEATGDSEAETGSSLVEEALEVLSDIKWADYIAKHQDKSYYSGSPVVINAASYDSFDNDNIEESSFAVPFAVLGEYEGQKDVLQTPDVGTVTWKVNVPESGLYAIDIFCYATPSKATSVERTLRINGEVPFNEVRNLILARTWVNDYSYDSEGNIVFIKDSNHNDKSPTKHEEEEWKTYTVCDPTGYYNGAYYFYFEAGENTIALEAQKEPLAIKTITLHAFEKEITYAEYKKNGDSMGYVSAPAGTQIRFEAETPSSLSDSTLGAKTDSSSAVTSPQHACYAWLNTIGGSSWATIGQWIEWSFDVPEGKAGYYTFNARFIQNSVAGMFVSRRFKVDGEIPFAEANNLEFMYNTNWQVGPFTDGSDIFEIYLTEGKHTFSLEVTLGNFGEIYAEVQTALTEINNIYLKILQITGTSPDSYMDYSFYNRIPNEIKRMKVLADTLMEVSEKFEAISGGASANSATLVNIAQILYKMNRNSEGQIAKNFKALKSNIGSLGTWLNDIKKQALTIDYFVIQPAGDKLPKANGNFFQNLLFELKAFGYSFIYDGYSLASVEESEEVVTVQVWTTVSREYAQIIRELIDKEFSDAYSNISVNLKLVAAGTLLPATLAGVGPDVMMGEGQSTVIDYAVRGAIVDLSHYDGFTELASRFNEAAMTPLTVALGSPDGDIAVFGIPQAQSFNVMFYRKDVLAQLGITIPDTWEDFKAVIPKLQSKNYMVGLGDKNAATSTFNMFLYQNGGSLFTDNGLTISYNTETSLKAFTDMCNYYTQYKFPVSYDAANRFRTGEMPILIADYISFYNQFTIFATELKGLWGFTILPGTVQADGTVNHSTISSVSAMVIMRDAVKRGTDEAGFCFMEWWMRTEIQSEYANELVALLGPAGKYATANTESFNSMPWTASELKTLNLVTKTLVGINEMPGSYIIPRYVSFPFLDVVNNNVPPAETLLDYVNAINEEMARKREELSRQFYIPSKNIYKDNKEG